jgi:hypothetical protein
VWTTRRLSNRPSRAARSCSGGQTATRGE